MLIVCSSDGLVCVCDGLLVVSSVVEVARLLVRKVLADYDKETILLISGTNTAHQAKAVLRMLTSFVMLGSSQAR